MKPLLSITKQPMFLVCPARMKQLITEPGAVATAHNTGLTLPPFESGCYRSRFCMILFAALKATAHNTGLTLPPFESGRYRSRFCNRLIVFVALFALTSVEAISAPLPQGRDHEIVDRLKQATQELLDAIAPGNKAVWHRYLAEGSIYADEEGRVLTKDELIKELNPLPKGYVGSIKIGDLKTLVQDGVVVISHRDREELKLYGQKIVTYFHMTNTWAKQRDGQWRLVSTQVMAIPNERKPAVIDPNSLEAFIGEYELAPEVKYVITREGSKLFGQRTGRAKEELLPLCVDIFYRKGVWRGEKVFERDAQGRVVRMLDRRENNDLIWRKVK